MAVEGLVLVHPTDATKNVTLNGSKWGLEELDLGNPARREELVSSIDASGAVPFRTAPRDNREVTARLRLIDATTMNAAMDSIAALERVLNEAERFATLDPDDPVLDHVRLVYTPADSTYSFSLIVYAAEITGIPRTLSGEDAGFFLKRPVVTIRAVCDPFAYGAGATSPAKTTWLDTTISGNAVSNSVTVPASGAIAGDVSPWTRITLADAASQVRNRVILGLREGESTTTATIGAASLTAIVGTVSSGVMTASSTDWAIAGQLPNQTRTGTFRVYLNGATSNSTGAVRLVVAPSGSSKRAGQVANLISGTTVDADLGEVSVDSRWDGWIQTTGSVKFSNVVLVPTDSFVEVNGAAPGEQLVGKLSVSDTLKASVVDMDARSLAAGEHSGSWDTISATSGHITGSNLWPLVDTTMTISGRTMSVYGARRYMSSMTVPAFAIAGTQDYLNVDVRADLRAGKDAATDIAATSAPFMGIVARYKDTTNYVVAGLAYDSGVYFVRPGLWKVVSGTLSLMWLGERRQFGGTTNSGGGNISWNGGGRCRLQVTADGRYWVSFQITERVGELIGLKSVFQTVTEQAAGQDPDLAQGGALGDSAESRVGLYDYNQASTPVVTREWRDFSASSLVGITPPPDFGG